MGKVNNQRLPVVQQQQQRESSRTFLCRRCSLGVCRLINFKCAVVLTLSTAAFVCALFWALPLRYKAGFDAKDSIKHSATVQAYFRLQKPVRELVPYVARLEYDLNGEIGVPYSKVAVLSMHHEDKSNFTDVVFGYTPDPINSTINPVSLSLLKTLLIDVFLQEYNLSLSSSLFGDPSSFEIFKFPVGITIIPEQAALILDTPQGLFNFTLNSSIQEIKENLLELKEQLKLGLHLLPNEMVYIQVTNKYGSTKDRGVTVEASVVSEVGTLSSERLRQLAQIITAPTQNLGLDHFVFGKVKEISLSAFLNHSLHPPTPSSSPCPAPSPNQISDTVPSPAPSPPCTNCYASTPSDEIPYLAPSPQNQPLYSLPPKAGSPGPSASHGSPNLGSNSPTYYPDSRSPLPEGIYGSRGLQERSSNDLVSPRHVLSSSALSQSSALRIQGSGLIVLMSFLLLTWIY